MLGKSHPLLRRVRALRAEASLRRAEGVLVAEGLHLAAEALSAGATIEAAVVSPGLRTGEPGRRLLSALAAAGVPCHETSEDRLHGIQDVRSPQPIVCLVRHSRHPAAEREGLLARAALVVVAHGIQDPGNLGAILRTTEAAGGDLLVATGPAVDLTHPRVVRASQGSIFRVPAWSEPFDTLAAGLRARGFRLAAADPGSGIDYREADLGGKLGVVLGGEGAGLASLGAAAWDVRLRIPMCGRVESLSVGAAAALLLFEVARRKPGGR